MLSSYHMSCLGYGLWESTHATTTPPIYISLFLTLSPFLILSLNLSPSISHSLSQSDQQGYPILSRDLGGLITWQASNSREEGVREGKIRLSLTLVRVREREFHNPDHTFLLVPKHICSYHLCWCLVVIMSSMMGDRYLYIDILLSNPFLTPF